MIESRDVPLPRNWEGFITLAENKADLARFLSEEIIAQAPRDKHQQTKLWLSPEDSQKKTM